MTQERKPYLESVEEKTVILREAETVTVLWASKVTKNVTVKQHAHDCNLTGNWKCT